MEKATLTLLELYQERQILNLVQVGAILDLPPMALFERTDWLYRNKYLCVEPRYAEIHSGSKNFPITVDTPLQITLEGQAVLQAHHEAKKQRKYDNIRYIITTSIAVAALITAIASIVLQYL